MSIKLTSAQAKLLGEIVVAGQAGVVVSTGYSTANKLVSLGYARWKEGRYGASFLVATEDGRRFRGV